jgi:hypothetical protein
MIQLDLSILQLEALSLVETDLCVSPSPYAAKTKDIRARGWLGKSLNEISRNVETLVQQSKGAA